MEIGNQKREEKRPLFHDLVFMATLGSLRMGEESAPSYITSVRICPEYLHDVVILLQAVQ